MMSEELYELAQVLGRLYKTAVESDPTEPGTKIRTDFIEAVEEELALATRKLG